MAVDLLNTKFSDIDLAFVKQYLRIEEDFTEDDIEIQLFIDVAKNFVNEQTGLGPAELDVVQSANILYLKLISDLYHNRGATTDKTSVDPIFNIMFKNMRKYENFFGSAN